MKKPLTIRTVHKKTAQALRDYKMICEGDRVLVAVSGEDSLSLLDILQEKAKFLPISYSLIAAHINLNGGNAQVIERYLRAKGITYHIIDVDMEKGRNERKTTECFWCSWKRREALFKLAEQLRCRKVALAHHLDDILETYLLNIFFQGESSTMPPKLRMFDGRFYIIRPLAYLEKKALADYARIKGIPAMPFECPYAKSTNREFMGNLLAQLQKRHPKVKKNLWRSMKNRKNIYLPKKVM